MFSYLLVLIPELWTRDSQMIWRYLKQSTYYGVVVLEVSIPISTDTDLGRLGFQ